MKTILLKIIIRIAHWLMVTKGTQLNSGHLLKAGWTIEEKDGKKYFIESQIKSRDKVWIEFEHHYYRVWHGDNRAFIALESSLEWLQMYLFILDKAKFLSTRKLL